MQPQRPPGRLVQDHRFDEYAEEHARARQAVATLRAVGDSVSARALARELGLQLEAHMASEEQEDGVFTWLVALDPSLDGQIDRLLEEHEEFRTLFAAIQAATDAEIQALTSSLADRLSLHEAAENAALEQAIRRV